MSLDKLTKRIENIAARVAEAEAGCTNITIGRVVEYLKNISADEGFFCADAIAAQYSVTPPLISPTKYRQILDAAYRMDCTDMFVLEGTGKAHYQYSDTLVRNLLNKKEQIAEKVAQSDAKFTDMAINRVIDYLKEMEANPESPDQFCESMISTQCIGMPFINQSKINLVLDAMYRESCLEMSIPEGTGTPHYSLKKQ